MLHYLDPADLDAIVISHCHADHIVDLVGMHVYYEIGRASCRERV